MKQKFVIILPLIIFLVLTSASPALAAPSISSVNGTVTKGQTITINGSGFSARGDYHQYNNSGLASHWKDWEDGSGTSGGWGSGGLQIQSGGARPGSTYFGRKPGAGYGMVRALPAMLGSTTFFISFWAKVSSDFYGAKFLRQDFGIASGNRDRQYWIATGSDYGAYQFGLRANNDLAGGPDPNPAWESGRAFTPGVWKRIDVLLMAASPSAIWHAMGVNNNSPYDSRDWNSSRPLLGGYPLTNLGAEQHSGFMDFDDLYIDYTQARVELSNASTWPAVTQSEIQIPLAWVDGQVQVRVNQGAFTAGQTAYLYVVDSNGNMNSSGFPVVIGSAGGAVDTTPPAAPTGVTVN